MMRFSTMVPGWSKGVVSSNGDCHRRRGRSLCCLHPELQLGRTDDDQHMDCSRSRGGGAVLREPRSRNGARARRGGRARRRSRTGSGHGFRPPWPLLSARTAVTRAARRWARAKARTTGRFPTSRERLADKLQDARVQNRYRSVVLVAPPRFLGLLRSSLDGPDGSARDGLARQRLGCEQDETSSSSASAMWSRFDLA